MDVISHGGRSKITSIVFSDALATKNHPRCVVASISDSASKSRRSTTLADGDVAKNFNKKLCVLEVYESYDVGLDIVFHSVEKVKKVLLCVLRVACRDTTYWLGITTDKQKASWHAFEPIFLQPMELEL